MLANVKTVKQFVKNTVDMRCNDYNRRIWQDKNKRDNTLRNVGFRFFNGNEATKVAEQLKVALFASGYTNNVKLTNTYKRKRDMWDRTYDSYYVRVIAKAN